jgi:hypothetical protein
MKCFRSWGLQIRPEMAQGTDRDMFSNVCWCLTETQDVPRRY